MSDFPFSEQEITKDVVLREFKENVNPEELIWHQDREDRKVKVIKSNNWKLQMDNELPVTLEVGKTYYIPAYEYHRVIKGTGDLVVEIAKNR
jgi:hypothetical protein